MIEAIAPTHQRLLLLVHVSLIIWWGWGWLCTKTRGSDLWWHWWLVILTVST